ncbi:Uncharacterized protein TCM_040530 [Theobroma cacao]|uniref:Uncharacterized protein n=1 Tax=Theobroma cacao TaxID=3641 RepID=A0A061GZ52_THECC|nr:Uncharacterized protein TCM_040530 [Theobroma cacao]
MDILIFEVLMSCSVTETLNSISSKVQQTPRNLLVKSVITLPTFWISSKLQSHFGWCANRIAILHLKPV